MEPLLDFHRSLRVAPVITRVISDLTTDWLCLFSVNLNFLVRIVMARSR